MNTNPFPLAGNDTSPGISTRIQGLIASSPVFLFMKGTPEMPQCGFSANVVGILQSLGSVL